MCEAPAVTLLICTQEPPAHKKPEGQLAVVVHVLVQPLVVHPIGHVIGAGVMHDPPLHVPWPVNIPAEQVGPGPQFPVG